ncbi:phosphoribosylformylglycinamidine synthase subunit PurQ [Natronoglycomyces albus]|uniref:Phosphoribosylformylglycinamidine synthase subunit PurQ n=1 Tax=Natronoglycomyces albus TaxID=2811108 RepID=A0A895XSS9_9ACTN|nr:phosphoribosylformylglycinamidine synthase subunit PurQ [Natronoglycomyces albus]QSB05320.1 phosphoribosylformylglycinamidine synthase subunit PurQ [Natronoglycomyces albus]
MASNSAEPRVRIGIVTFPGSLDDRDAARAVARAGAVPVRLWHDEGALRGVQAVWLPGGFSYGDYLRSGAIARFSHVMDSVADAARGGMPVIGVCNGFQVLCESGLLPGALTQNAHMRYRNRPAPLRVESTNTAWTSAYRQGAQIVIPAKHKDGRFQADASTLEMLEDQNRVVLRYLDNPNGSVHDIAGITNAEGNVVGMMPHPEHAIDQLTGPSTDGRGILASVLSHVHSGATA